jgi:CMP-N-acetylneuraminic acid synthetase
MTVAVIPARGGSKRVPRKNIVDIGGKPMMAWTITAALESGVFDSVVVSTDDPEIAGLARDWGAVPVHRGQFADDHTPVSTVTLYVLEQLKAEQQKEYETVVQLMPNCPFRSADHIRAAVETFVNRAARFQISCFKYGWMNPWWAARLGPDLCPVPLFPEALKTRSQDLDELYCPTGAIWIANTAALAGSRTFYGPGHIWCPLDWKAAMDIDSPEDLDFARALLAAGL